MTKFHVPDMSCGHCIAAIKQAVAGVESAADVQCDLASHTVSISGAVPADRLAAALTAAGYPATPIG